ncbi:DNA polymerase III subunit beta [compost metagenome]
MLATATNSHGMASIKLGNLAKPFGAIVTREAAEILAKAAPGTLSVSRSMVALQSDEARIVAKNIDGTFPDWRRVMPSNRPRNSITLRRAALIDAVALSKLTRDAMKLRPMTLRANAAVLTVSAIGLTGEQIDSEVEIAAEVGDAMDVGINGDLFEPMLKTASEEEVTISWDGPNCALLTESGPLRALLMPMRI